MPLHISKLKRPTLEDLFRQTKDLHFLVMAIGEAQDAPPEWAIQACQIYYFERQVGVESTGGGRPPKHSVDDGLRLDQVADLIVEKGITLTDAVRDITQQEADGTDFRRLMRIWSRHLHLPSVTIGDGKPKKTNKWLDMARRRKHDRYFNECLAEALAEIREGNLSSTLSDQLGSSVYSAD